MGAATRYRGSKFIRTNNANLGVISSSYAPRQYPCQGECDNESKNISILWSWAEGGRGWGGGRGLESERRDDRPNYFGSHRPGQLFLVSRTSLSHR